MCPLSLNRDDMNSLGDILPSPLNLLWNEAFEKVDLDGPMAKAGSYSLAMWANFLFSVVLFRDIKTLFLEIFETLMPQPHMIGPHREDLQYLIGPALCFRAESSLAHFLEGRDVGSPPVSYPLFDHSVEILGERIPQPYEEHYKNKLSNNLDKAQDINDVLQAIFSTQHTDIELLSRNDTIDDDGRLEFGLTYSRLCQIVKDKFFNAADIDIHECFDRLVDNGAIVPRYLDMALPGKPAIWVRTFRVGEGTVQQIAHMVRVLFEILSSKLGNKNELPPLIFEKFCALALCVAVDVPNLRSIKSLGIIKSFHLYGARPALKLGKKQEFLTEWAVRHNILNRCGADTEVEGSYSLPQNIEISYPRSEFNLDIGVKDSLEDLASLVAAIHNKLKNPALITLTSVASKQELQRAIEAELELWLYDNTASVHKGLAKLAWLAALDTPTKKILTMLILFCQKQLIFRTSSIQE
jgi:hypothetical protein